MSRIERVELSMLELPPKSSRVDAIQSFTSMEMPFVQVFDNEGLVGTGFTYTIGTGGKAVHELLLHYILPQLLGHDPRRIEQIWTALFGHMRFVTGGPLSSSALAAVDTALWDMRCLRAGESLCVMAGGARDSAPVYETEGGWLQLQTAEIVENARETQRKGFGGFKMKVGRAPEEDVERLRAVRNAVGPGFDIMIDANQAFRVDEAIRRAALYEPFDPVWFEEPLPADDVAGHARTAAATSIPIAVGESMSGVAEARGYLEQHACGILQVDAGRIGGITPWLKAAHLAEAFNIAICPHFLMELHVSLVSAVPNGRWVEYIPQLDMLASAGMRIENGRAVPGSQPGLGLEWDWSSVEKHRVEGAHEVLTT